MNSNLCKTEIGGYFELECGHSSSIHAGASTLNSARSALRVTIRTAHITEIFVPSYTCPLIWDAIKAENCNIHLYDIGLDFLPVQDFPHDAFVLYTNYFGVCANLVDILAQKYRNLIIDNAQAFYMPFKGYASFYSPRKFFGLPDGGLLYCRDKLQLPDAKGISYDMCSHLLKRIDADASTGYADFQRNDEALGERGVQQMSALTQALLGNIDYTGAKAKRLENFAFLHKALSARNKLTFALSDCDVPMIYPFLTDDSDLRTKLIENKIFVATYWPGTEDTCPPGSTGAYLRRHLIPLPIDQRYGINEMKRIIEKII